MSGKTKPVSDMNSQEALPPQMVQDDRYYRVTLQFGGLKRRWRKYVGLPRTIVPSAEPGKVDGRVNLRIFEDIGPLEGRIVNGLIGEHKDWLEAFRTKNEDRGLLDNQLLVLSIDPTNDLPDSKKSKFGEDIIALIEAIVGRVVSQTPKAAKA